MSKGRKQIAKSPLSLMLGWGFFFKYLPLHNFPSMILLPFLFFSFQLFLLPSCVPHRGTKQYSPPLYRWRCTEVCMVVSMTPPRLAPEVLVGSGRKQSAWGWSRRDFEPLLQGKSPLRSHVEGSAALGLDAVQATGTEAERKLARVVSMGTEHFLPFFCGVGGGSRKATPCACS